MTPRPPLNRRTLLRAAVGTALAVPGATAVAACTSGYADTPDPLRPLWRSARADADAARALARSSPEHADLAQRIAAIRSAHADALWTEIKRLNRPVDEDAPRPRANEGHNGVDALARILSQARTAATELVPTMPRHRAGLVGSVAAGCAAAQQLGPELNGAETEPAGTVETGGPAGSAVSALQKALGAEHAAVWVYGLVNAFLPAAFDDGIAAGMAEHRARRDACERVLNAAGVASRPTDPAYTPPDPVTDEKSAVKLVVVAETDVTTAWHGVLERADDRGIRTVATRALITSAVRGTHWRVEAGRKPAALALPGRDPRAG